MFILNKIVNRFVWRPYYRRRLGACGSNCRIGHSTYIYPYSQFFIGDDFFCGPFCYFTSSVTARVSIGNAVMFGPRVKLIGGNHNLGWTQGHMRYAPKSIGDKGIRIEDGVWIGSDSIILDGAIIPEGTVVGAGSVVTKPLAPYTICAGAPARIIKRRFSSLQLSDILVATNSSYTLDAIEKIYCAYSL